MISVESYLGVVFSRTIVVVEEGAATIGVAVDTITRCGKLGSKFYL